MVDCVLLVTGTISPNKGIRVKKSDKIERYKEYISCLRFYICNSNLKRIVFCENSNFHFDKAPLEKLAEKYDKRIEILQFQGNEKKINNRGKGFGEGEIIEYALNNSMLLKECDYFIKVTGRLRVTNLNSIVNKMYDSKVYFNVNLYCYPSVDTRLYGMPIPLYRKFFENQYRKVNDKKGKYIERVFFDTIRENRIKIYNFLNFPHIVGYSGTVGMEYSTDIRKVKKVYQLCSFFRIYNLKCIYMGNYLLLNRKRRGIIDILKMFIEN